MKKLFKTLATAIITLALTATAFTAFAETAETTTTPKTYDKYELACIRSFKENEFNKYFPDEYFGDHYGKYFDEGFEIEWELGIMPAEGYEFNLDDFSDLGVTSVIEPDQWTEPAGLYRLFCENYSKSMQIAEILNQDAYSDKVEQVYAGMSRVILIEGSILPTREEMKKYEPYLQETYGITWGDMDEDDTVTINDIVRYFRLFSNPQTKLEPIQFYQADLYQDGKVNVLDVLLCIDKVIGKDF
jgi:hypothetical protein